MPEQPLVLTQSALRDFAECRRRFQLRYLQQLPWPQAPLYGDTAVATARGREFHRLLERHFLGIPVDEEALSDTVLRGWWASFARSGLAFPDGRRWLEHELTIPAGDHFLSGRFDLLIVTELADRVTAHLYDWKTSRPRPVEKLRQDWQTRLYLAMLAQSGSALTEGERPLAADNLAMTYWYAAEPDVPRTIRYSSDSHARNWAQILDLVAQINRAQRQDAWTLTADLSRCRHCAYQVHCGRQEGGYAAVVDEDEAGSRTAVHDSLFEPYTP